MALSMFTTMLLMDATERDAPVRKVAKKTKAKSKPIKKVKAKAA